MNLPLISIWQKKTRIYKEEYKITKQTERIRKKKLENKTYYK